MSAQEATEPTRQQARTRAAIRQAFFELLFTGPYPAVSMAAVAARANVGRSTLYEHFRTKDELFRASVRVPLLGLAELVGAPALPPHIGGVLQHFRDNQALARVLFYLPAYKSMQLVLAELIEDRLAAHSPPVIPLSLVATQISAAQFAILTPWILGQVAVAPAAMAEALYRSSNAIADVLVAPLNDLRGAASARATARPSSCEEPRGA